jgi:hypothetical protein
MKEMPMRRAIRAVVVAATTTAATTVYAGTDFVSKWRNPEAQPGTFRGKKVVALFIHKEEALRRGVEETLASELTRRGAQGVPAYSLIPTAELRDEEKAKARITASGATGVVVLRLVGSQSEVSSTPGMGYVGPYYGGFWGGYYGYSWGMVYDTGYVRTDNVFHVETLVYSLDQNKLVWAGQSKTTNPDSADELVKKLVGKVADEMKKQGLIQKAK